jgi:hypothetical protein
MNFSITSFIKDRNVFDFELFKNKYNLKIPTTVTILDSLTVLKNTNNLSLMIDSSWYGDHRDKHVHYLIKKHNKYEVFISERGNRHCLETFDSLELAIFTKIDALFNEMNHAASDSRINA